MDGCRKGNPDLQISVFPGQADRSGTLMTLVYIENSFAGAFQRWPLSKLTCLESDFAEGQNEDDRVIALREIHIPSGAKVTTIRQILAHSFRLDSSQITFKIRNSRGSLIPLNCCMLPNSKQMPYVLEVAKNYQHVNPRPRSIPTTVINKTLKSRLQSIVKRIERLEELLPQNKLKHHEKMTKDIELLNQKLVFLHKRMQMAESYCWDGILRRAPLW